MRKIPEWDDYFLSMLDLVKQRSSDSQTQHAAILTENNRVISMGYNGFPVGINNLPDARPEKYKWMTHGEINAIVNCKMKPEGPITCYITGTPCNVCSKAMWNFGVRRIVSLNKSWASCVDDDYEVLGKLIQNGLEFVRKDEIYTVIFSMNNNYKSSEEIIKYIKDLLK